MATSQIHNPNYAALGTTYFIATSVSATASLTPAMSFRGLYIQSSVTVNIIGVDGVTQSFANPAIGQILWAGGVGLTLTGSVTTTPVLGVR